MLSLVGAGDRRLVKMKTMGTREGFINVLAVPARSPDIPESADVYGWLVGSWELEVCHYLGMDHASGSVKGEAHFGWVLQGRAVQDVWFYPKRTDNKAELQ